MEINKKILNNVNYVKMLMLLVFVLNVFVIIVINVSSSFMKVKQTKTI